MSDDEPLIQIGELAAAVGLTVRTLHHYDAIGLLVPAQRSHSGRRCTRLKRYAGCIGSSRCDGWGWG